MKNFDEIDVEDKSNEPIELANRIFLKLLFVYLWPVDFVFGWAFKNAPSGALGIYCVLAYIFPPIFWACCIIVVIMTCLMVIT